MAIGLVTTDVGPLLLDHVGLSGMPFVVLDAEHTGLTPADCAAAVRRLAATGTRVCVRVPDGSPPTLADFVATGAAEIVLPRVGGAADIAAASACVRYPPEGTRSRAPSAANAYGTAWGVPALSVIVETLDSVDNAAEIAACGLVERAWLGLADLRGELERSRPDRPVDAVVDELLQTFGAMDLVVPVADPGEAGAMYRRGARACYLYWDKYLHRVLARLTAADAP
jgi:2-keto-3-deoxy-L-rhamnonate aldolase RhmA